MSDLVLQVRGISKRYKKGISNSRSLQQGLINWWHGKSDDRPEDHIWALKDVSFDLNKGDVLGFMGNNGAGKSTLLKIISRIVMPTEGRIRGIGRVGSLLEVGTGFHGELTGRENIFLNGTLLGMSKEQVRTRFDKIVDFSGIETFLDTPVKRYSSGMYMRLAFAIAAHLDSEILILDEVLAVGDLEFQQKCMNRIKEMALEEGRTIMFVSHNIQSVRSLCNKALFLSEGRVENFGITDHVINSYITKSNAYVHKQDFSTLSVPPGNECIRVRKVALKPRIATPHGNVTKASSVSLNVEFVFSAYEASLLTVDFRVFNFSGDYLFNVSSEHVSIRKGHLLATCIVPGNFLNSGSYYISICFLNQNVPAFEFHKCLSFFIEDKPDDSFQFSAPQGIITPQFKAELQPI